MFDDLVAILRNRQWGSRFKDGERNIDTGVQELADELARYFSHWGKEPIDQTHTLILNNQTNGPSIVINNEGDVDHHGVWILNEAGQSAKLGIGLGSEGLLANEIIIRPEFIQDPEIVHTAYSDVGGGNGGATLEPKTAGVIPGVAPGPGWKPNNFHVSAADNGSFSNPGTQYGSGYGQGNSGSGIPYDLGNRAGVFSVNAGVGQMLSQFQFSNNNLQMTYNGTQYHTPDYEPLSTATADANYQPLDSDLTTIAAANNGSVLAATTASFLIADETKLDGIETAADVTDATNVDAAGAVMNTDTTTASMSFVVDEDDFTSNSATKLPTQQSVKAYVDTNVTDFGLSDEVDNGNSGSADTIDFTTGRVHLSTVTADCTYTLTAPSNEGPLWFRLAHSGVSMWNLTWPGTVDWESSAPATITSGETIIVEFYWDGSEYFGSFKSFP